MSIEASPGLWRSACAADACGARSPWCIYSEELSASSTQSRLRAWWNGRHARLRIWCRKAWRFKSSRAHHLHDPIDNKGDCEFFENGGRFGITVWHNSFKIVQNCSASFRGVNFIFSRCSLNSFRSHLLTRLSEKIDLPPL